VSNHSPNLSQEIWCIAHKVPILELAAQRQDRGNLTTLPWSTLTD